MIIIASPVSDAFPRHLILHDDSRLKKRLCFYFVNKAAFLFLLGQLLIHADDPTCRIQTRFVASAYGFCYV